MFEWLAIAVDAPILVLVLIITLLTVIAKKIHSHYNETPGHLIQSITEAPDHFYEKLIELFHHPKYLPLGVAGMFVLHLITEIGVYLIPYSFGFRDPLYLNIYDELHRPLFSLTGAENLFQLSSQGFSHIIQTQYFIGYLGNILALLIFMIIPIWVFAYEFRHKNKPLSETSILEVFTKHDSKLFEVIGNILRIAFPLFFVFFFTLQAFTFKSIEKGLLAGVDILTQTILVDWFLYLSIGLLLLLFAQILAYKKLPIILTISVLSISVLMVLYYSYLYLQSMVIYGISLLNSFTTSAELFAILTNISISVTIIFTIVSILSLYVLAPLLLLFMYIPVDKKHRLYAFFPKHMRDIQKFYHIHYHHHHDDHIHGDKVQLLTEHIKKQLEVGHELYVIVEHLRNYGWEWADIEKATHVLGKKKDFVKEIVHKMHPKHSEFTKIKRLSEWIQEKYDKGHSLPHLIDALKRHNWPEEDIRLALTHIKLKGSDKHLKDFLDKPVQLK